MLQSILNEGPLYGSLAETIPVSVIQTDLIQRPDLTPAAKSVFALFWRAKHQRTPLKHLTFGIPYMARELGLSTRTVQRAVHQLADRGLISIRSRHRGQTASPTSHEYVVHWHAYAPVNATPTIGAAPLSVSAPTSATEPFTMPADSAFTYPAMSGASVTSCQEEEAAESEVGQAIEGHFGDPIENLENNKPNMISTPALKGAPTYTFESPDALLMFLLIHLKVRGITPKYVMRWEKEYGLARLATIAQWVFSAPPGAIRSVGAWISRALREEWSAPAWVRTAWTVREHKLAREEATASAISTLLATRAEKAREEQDLQRKQENESIEWSRLQARWSDVPSALVERAKELAQEALGQLATLLFTPEHPTVWRLYHLMAAREVWAEGIQEAAYV